MRQIVTEMSKMEILGEKRIPYNSGVVTQWRRLTEKEANLKTKITSMENQIYSCNYEVDSVEMKILCQQLFLLNIQYYNVTKRTFDCAICLERNSHEVQTMDNESYIATFSFISGLYIRIKSEYHLQWCEDVSCQTCQSDGRPVMSFSLISERPYFPFRHSPVRLSYLRAPRESDPNDDNNDEDPC